MRSHRCWPSPTRRAWPAWPSPPPGVRPAPAPPGYSRPASPGFYARSGGRPSSRRSGKKSTPRHQAQADRQRRSPTKPRKPPNAAIIVPVTWRQSGATKKKCRLETTAPLKIVHEKTLRQARFSCVSMVELSQVVVELGVGKTDELLQGRSRKVTVLVVDGLDPGAVDGEQLLAEQVQLAAQQHELAEIRYGLEVGSQIAE